MFGLKSLARRRGTLCCVGFGVSRAVSRGTLGNFVTRRVLGELTSALGGEVADVPMMSFGY